MEKCYPIILGKACSQFQEKLLKKKEELPKGYLLDKFLTDFANAKEDEYGGTIQNHIRFHCEVLESVLEVVGGKIKFSYCILKFFYIFTSQSSSALFLFF